MLEQLPEFPALSPSPSTAPTGTGLDVDDVASDLKDALRMVGLVLPSLRVDPIGWCGEAHNQLIELGRVNLETALKITTVLTRKATKEEREAEKERRNQEQERQQEQK